jgi:hypothetical protein
MSDLLVDGYAREAWIGANSGMWGASGSVAVYDDVPRTWRFGARLSHLVEHLLYRLYAVGLTVVPGVDR